MKTVETVEEVNSTAPNTQLKQGVNESFTQTEPPLCLASHGSALTTVRTCAIERTEVTDHLKLSPDSPGLLLLGSGRKYKHVA